MSVPLHDKLKKALIRYNEEERYLIGRMNDLQLREILQKVYKGPTFEQIVHFTNCLNLFYSTRLHAAVKRGNIALGTRNKVILKVAEVIEKKWEPFGLQYVQSHIKYDHQLVEKLRAALERSLKRNAYSFTTKFFHQLNSRYPILDSNVNAFMNKEGFKKGVNFYNHSYEVFLAYYQEMMKRLHWPLHQVNQLDNAMWTYTDLHPKRYFPGRYKAPLGAIATLVV